MDEKMTTEDSQKNREQAREFKVGDLAVYPAHGVGKIEAIEKKVVGGSEHDFYVMKIFENSMVIMIPVWNVEQVGLRDVIHKDNIADVYDVISKDCEMIIDKQAWNRRHKEYMDKIRTGSIYDVAEVYRDLSILKNAKDLSFGERKLYDTAQILLVSELSTASGKGQEVILSKIESFFNG